MSVEWELKIQALLALPPDFALDPNKNNAKQRAKEYLQLLGLNDSVPEHVQKAHEIAFGLDVPPFVRHRDKEGTVFRDKPTLTHPLSGQHDKLDKLLQIEQSQNALQAALSQFSTLKGEYKKLFIALWRFLAEVAHKQAPNPYWGLLPADPRIPDHSIWDHASLASAIAGTWDKEERRHRPALLLFTISSVQEFLMTARRTQDLWMGSYLLSYLTWEAIKVIADKCGPDCLIYPDLRGQPLTDLWIHQSFRINEKSLWDALNLDKPVFLEPQANGLGEELKIASFPNMFTAIVPKERASDLAQEAIDAVCRSWKRIGDDVRAAVEKVIQEVMLTVTLSRDSWRDRWEKEKRNHDLINQLGIFWVIYSLDRAPGQNDGDAKVQQAIEEFNDLIELEAGDAQNAFKDFAKLYAASKGEANIGMGYSLVSQLAARTLTNRKSLRDFRQHEAPAEKCSLCGVRSVLHPDLNSFQQHLLNQTSEPGHQEAIKRMKEHALLRAFWEALTQIKTDDVRLAGRIRKGDRLCSVCLTKRLAWEQHFLRKTFINLFDPGEAHLLFPSTSSIATASFKKKVLEKLKDSDPQANSLKKAVENYVEKVLSFLRPNGGQGRYDIYYHSAPIPFLEKLRKEVRDLDQEVLKHFIRIDGEWLFDESFVPEKIEREYLVKKEMLWGLETAKQAANELRAAAEKFDLKPTKYYALLAMDGDYMGHWLSGQNGPPLLKLLHPVVAKAFTDNAELKDLLCRKRPLGPTLHMALTAAQKNFALQIVRQIVEEEHVGKLIYAGGDDVLAFVPISELLPVLRKLRWLCSGESVKLDTNAIQDVGHGFATRVNSPKDKRRFMLLGSEFSLSAGVAIVHYTHPFSHAVEEAYRAMKEHAKKELDRNAFAIYLMKRSGEPLETGAKWKLKTDAGEFSTLERLEAIVAAMQDELSSKLAYDLKEEAAGMALLTQEAQVSELRRLTYRHLSSAMSKEEKERFINDKLVPLLQGLQAQNAKKAWERLIGLLLLARFLAQGGSDGGE